MATTSYYSLAEGEKKMIGKILQLSSKENNYLQQQLDALLDSSKICEEHELPYQFYDEKQFYCPLCLDSLKQKPQQFKYIHSNPDELILKLEANLLKERDYTIPEIDFDQRLNEMINQLQQQSGQDQNQNALLQSQTRAILEQRKKFLEVQEFVSHISMTIDRNQRKAHEEIHYADISMKPRYDQEGGDSKKFLETLKRFQRAQYQIQQQQ